MMTINTRLSKAAWSLVDRLDRPGAQWAQALRYFAVCLAVALFLGGWRFESLWLLVLVAAVR
jgi:hypothetical protein